MVGCRAIDIPDGDATGQDALDDSAVKPFEDRGTHDKYFQSPEGEKVLSCPLHEALGVFGMFVGDVNTKELETLNLSRQC